MPGAQCRVWNFNFQRLCGNVRVAKRGEPRLRRPWSKGRRPANRSAYHRNSRPVERPGRAERFPGSRTRRRRDSQAGASSLKASVACEPSSGCPGGKCHNLRVVEILHEHAADQPGPARAGIELHATGQSEFVRFELLAVRAGSIRETGGHRLKNRIGRRTATERRSCACPAQASLLDDLELEGRRRNRIGIDVIGVVPKPPLPDASGDVIVSYATLRHHMRNTDAHGEVSILKKYVRIRGSAAEAAGMCGACQGCGTRQCGDGATKYSSCPHPVLQKTVLLIAGKESLVSSTFWPDLRHIGNS